MARSRKTRIARQSARQDNRLAFETLSIEGALLSADWLARVARLKADGQSAADYRIHKGLDLRDEIARYWRIAQAEWSELEKGRAAGGSAEALANRFVVALLQGVFGFESLKSVYPVEIGERHFPIGHAALEGRVPVVVAPVGSELEARSPIFGDDGRQRSAFDLCQEFLNAEDNALWGVACNGTTLRLVRDNVSLTRPAWIEVDLEGLFKGDHYADFAVLWLLIHESRFGKPGQKATESYLESWRQSGIEEGTRALDHLRTNVEKAALALGQGFIENRKNKELREALIDGTLTVEGFYQELLRLAYRLIFLLTVEERKILHPSKVDQDTREIYENGYSLKQLRERSVKRSAHDRLYDHWESVKIVFEGLGEGRPELGLPALAGLFSRDQCPHLDRCYLANHAFLLGLFQLSWLKGKTGLERVNWKDMGPEELGSVYESLLELVPEVSVERREFRFAGGTLAAGTVRKKTGSYYTPSSLVQVLLDTALEPVVERTIAANPEDPTAALLSLSVVDPACGSGHFLLGAARRLAAHLARLDTKETPSPEEHRKALRRVVGHCLYGVDINPLAVELCKVSLWLEAVVPGQPLAFLDSHIQHGNALYGTTPELMKNGIPDKAWKAIEGDDRKSANTLKKANRITGQHNLDGQWSTSDTETQEILKDHTALEATADTDLNALRSKEQRWREFLASAAYRHQKLVADSWCAAFVWPKEPGDSTTAAPVNDIWIPFRLGLEKFSDRTTEITDRLSAEHAFLHWHLAFPGVWEKGGFDVLLGNPPWERIKIQEKEFFAVHDADIANATNAAARKEMIAELPFKGRTDLGARRLWEKWSLASRASQGLSHFVRASGRYPLCGKGDINTYALFAEHNRSALNSGGRAGFIVPTGIATDATTQEYFRSLVEKQQLFAFYSFENEEFVFPAVHHAFRFALITIDASCTSPQAQLVFFARQINALREPDRRFSLTATDFSTLNPNTKTCPTFRSKRDADINLAIYRKVGVLWRENDKEGNPWGLRFMRMLDMANDSGLFRERPDLEAAGWESRGNEYVLEDERLLPLIEAKMVHHFDHRFGTYEGQSDAQKKQGKLPELNDVQHADPHRVTRPRYWVSRAEVDERLEEVWDREWLLGWRDICRSTDKRTVIASLLPRVAVGHKLPLIFSVTRGQSIAALYANLCSFALDYCARQKVGGTSLTYFIVKQLPVLSPATYLKPPPWRKVTTCGEWLLPRVLELTYTAHDLAPFARDCSYKGPPFRWEADRRFLVRSELDAAFFHLYGISRDDVDHIMNSFSVVRKQDEDVHETYRTKDKILEIYDAMANAIETQQEYVSPLESSEGF